MIDTVFRWVFFAFVLLLIQGCAQWSNKALLDPGTVHSREKLYQLNAWHFDGRVGVQTSKKGWTANLFWEHEGGQDRLRVSGPLGQGTVSIVVQENLIYINEGDGKVTSSSDPEALLSEKLGFSVPLNSLRYWVLGMPNPSFEYETSGSSGFSQIGWILDYDQFGLVKQFPVPNKMAVQNGNLKLKLLVDEWVITN